MESKSTVDENQVQEFKPGFYSGFSARIGGVDIGFVYSNAFKSLQDLGVDEAKIAHSSLKALFQDHQIVIGDLNSTPAALGKELAILSLTRKLHDFPTYLFPASEGVGTLTLPCFDNAVWDGSKISNVITKPHRQLPRTVQENPRNLVEKMKLLSDHIAVEVQLEGGFNVISHNIADPLLWSQYFPAAGQGFELNIEAEEIRQQKLLVLVQHYIAQYDVVFLQEVPAKLARSIQGIYPNATITDMHSHVPVEDVSKLVLIIK